MRPFTFRASAKKLVSDRWQSFVFWLRGRAARLHLKSVFLVFNVIQKSVLARYFEKRRRPDVVTYESDNLLHPSVYITFYVGFTNRLSPAVRFRLVSALFGKKRGTSTVYLDARPDEAMKRIEARGAERDNHENVHDLEALRAEFEKVLPEAERCGYDMIRIDTNDKSRQQVVDEVEAAVRQRLREL